MRTLEQSIARAQCATKLAVFRDMGLEFWITLDHSAGCYEVWTDANCQEHIGCADTVGEAKAIVRDYCEEMMHG